MISLDKSRIPPEKLDDPRLEREEEAARQGVEQEWYRVGICLHEAAHAIYFERAGVPVELHGPVILYDSEHDEFITASAAVRPVEAARANKLALACAYAAGGVAKRVLIKGAVELDEGGDQSDFADFTLMAKRGGTSADEISALWERAKRDVEKDLRSPAFRQELWERARDFEQQLLKMI